MEDQIQITTREGERFDIPVEGSLGLLALGDIGVWAWRQKIDEVKRGMAVRSQQSSDSVPKVERPADGQV